MSENKKETAPEKRNTDNEQAEPIENPPTGKNINYKAYFWVLIGFLGFILVLIVFNGYKKHQAEMLQKAEYEKYVALHQKQVKDSLDIVNKNKALYMSQLKTIQVRDSAFSTLRYKKGDVVYLKPDSLKGCVWGLESDSMMFNYSYYIIVSNKNQDPVIYKREDKLLY